MFPSLRSWLQHLRDFTQEGRALLRTVVHDSALDPFPLRRSLLGYGKRSFLSDFRAGVSVSMLDIPQGMAYALIAGLPLQYGITCSAVAALVGPLLSSSRHTIFGPTNATAFMVFSYFAAYPQLDRLSMMPLLVFMTAALLIAGAFLRVADLTQFISRTVVVAYVTGASILITMNQLPVLLGIPAEMLQAGGHVIITLPGHVYRIFTHLGQAQWLNIAFSVTTLALFLTIKRWLPRWPTYALTLVAASLLGLIPNAFGLHLPTFSNATFTWSELLPPFPDFISGGALANASRLFGLALALAFLATLENSAMSKTLAAKSYQRVDPNQDMLALGAANLACAYFSGMSASCSLTRSALNFAAGARTGLASMCNGLCCLVGALTIGGAVAHIPRAALATLVVCVAVSLFNRRHIWISVNATRSDAVVFVITLFATLMLPLHVAIFVGIGVSVILYLRKASRPSLVEYEFNEEGNLAEARQGGRQHPAISIVHVEGELFFASADLFRTQIQRSCADPNLRIVILRLKNARHLDATCAMAIEELVRSLRADGRDLIVSGVVKDLYRVLKDAGMAEVIGKDNIFPASPTNPNLSTRNALRRAQEILGIKDAEVRIYYDPSKSPKT
ncbi:SulP family inorganic anion transporter [Prosthecobacter sp.]|uniref:SulP family inorganic anion transporter n=1 Tax=Prosthecobacter sp. TaxID=1965333 RepID=UPI001D345896|nr:SulP family inorganic anion transporter [Prosthecobacter sp.]MCB1275315.1 SulP family inorganic anion transporter [Prosthecobacter sp.]